MTHRISITSGLPILPVFRRGEPLSPFYISPYFAVCNPEIVQKKLLGGGSAGEALPIIPAFSRAHYSRDSDKPTARQSYGSRCWPKLFATSMAISSQRGLPVIAILRSNTVAVPPVPGSSAIRLRRAVSNGSLGCSNWMCKRFANGSSAVNEFRLTIHLRPLPQDSSASLLGSRIQLAFRGPQTRFDTLVVSVSKLSASCLLR